MEKIPMAGGTWYQRLTNVKTLATYMVKFRPIMIKKKAYSSRQHEVSVSKQDSGDGSVVRINLVESKNKIEINVTFMNNVWAFPLYTEVWLYPREEYRRAVKTYNRIVNVLEDLKTDVEEDELLTPSVQGKAREELRYIDIDRKKPTNIPSLEAARHEAGEPDWRNSLYGNRYPQQVVYIDNKGVIQISNGPASQKT